MPLGDFLNSALGFRVKQHRLQYSILQIERSLLCQKH